jgi:hypothetical protein
MERGKISDKKNLKGLRMPGEGADSWRQSRRRLLRGLIGMESADAGAITRLNG